MKIPILKEFERFEWFEWFGPSPIEPFNSGRGSREGRLRARAQGLRLVLRQQAAVDAAAEVAQLALEAPARLTSGGKTVPNWKARDLASLKKLANAKM